MKKASNRIPKVSIIVPAFNVEKYIAKCLNSILKQTYKDYEVLIINDGSTDNTPVICEQFAKQHPEITIFNKKNGGLSSARNYGIKKARGKYVTFIDSDDYIEPTYLYTLIDDITANNCEISMVKHNIVYPHKTINTGTHTRIKLDSQECLKKMLYGDDVDVSAWAKLYEKNLFTNIEYPNNRLFEDSATTYLLIDKANKIFLNSTPLYNYIIRNDSITNKSFNKNNLDLIEATFQMTSYIESKYPMLKQACERRNIYAHLSVFRKIALADNNTINKSYGKKVFSYIKDNRKKVLRDKFIPKRDRIALRFANNYTTFRIINILYEKLRGTA